MFFFFFFQKITEFRDWGRKFPSDHFCPCLFAYLGWTLAVSYASGQVVGFLLDK